MNPSKQKGTAWETALVRWFRERLFDAKRIVLHGNKDEGDVEVTGGPVRGDRVVHLEAKNCKALSLAAWVDEAEAESLNAGVPVVVVAKRKGTTDPGKAYVIMSLNQFVEFL